MAADDAAEPEPSASQNTIFSDGLIGIFGAARLESTGRFGESYKAKEASIK